mgnify:CR=1 FL=1
MPSDNRLAGDLDHILEHTRSLWDELRGERLFITGGTGFFGCWLLESLAWANDRLGLRLQAWVLTRHPGAFRRKAPHLAGHAAIQLHLGDVRSFAFPAGRFSLVIHAATESSAQLNAEQPLLMLDTIVAGTRRTLDFAIHCSAQRMLLTSSGAVYGRQPPELSHVPEDYAGGPDPLDAASAYAEGKRLAELLCALYARQAGLQVKIARDFAFVGPYLPLDRHFAIGNFIADGLRGGPIRVLGDGTPHRSYLYAADLVIWLWTILLRGQPGRAYNVGSEEAISIAQLAALVAAAFQPALPVHIQQQAAPGHPAERYVPDTRRAREELGLQPTIALPAAIRRTIEWHL